MNGSTSTEILTTNCKTNEVNILFDLLFNILINLIVDLLKFVKNFQVVGIPVAQKGKLKTRQILVGWDKSRSFTFLGLALCFVLWACIYFPLIILNN